MKSKLFFIFILVGFSCFSQLPDGFIYVENVIPDITVELRYHTSNNFVGTPIDGYQANTLILTKEAANALKQVQEEYLQSQFYIDLTHLFLYPSNNYQNVLLLVLSLDITAYFYLHSNRDCKHTFVLDHHHLV